MLRVIIICTLIIVCAQDAACKNLRQKNFSLQSDENASGKRTLMISKLVLLPILAGVGVKFLVLLPIILSKIALLGILSFVSSNLSLLVSAIMGVRSYFFEDKPTDEDYDYDGRYKGRYESYHDSHKDPYEGHRHHDDNYDSQDKSMFRHKLYEFSYPASKSHYQKYRDHHDDHKDSKKRFRPFKLLGRIRDVIKDHFHKSEGYGEKYREYDSNNNYRHHSHDLSDDHEEYNYKVRGTKYTNSDQSKMNHGSGLEGEYYEGYKVPKDWSHKDQIRSNHALNGEQNQDQAMRVSSGSLDGQLKIALENNAGELMYANPNVTQPTTGYKVYENDRKFKQPFIVLSFRPQTGDSDSSGAFYNTDYKIADFQTVQQADTSK